jgi:orotate phosphoribosyltransferase
VNHNTAAQQLSIPSTDDEVLQRDDPRWKILHDIILERSLLKDRDFILSSGEHSTYLFQLRQTTMLGQGQALIAEIILEYMQKHDIHCIGGKLAGAVPIGQSVLALAYTRGYEVDHFFVRKEKKPHGAEEKIDGYVRPDSEVLIVDDVATKGGSIKDAIEGLLAEHPSCFVKRALVVVDREAEASAMLARRGVQLLSFFKKHDFPISD